VGLLLKSFWPSAKVYGQRATSTCKSMGTGIFFLRSIALLQALISEVRYQRNCIYLEGFLPY